MSLRCLSPADRFARFLTFRIAIRKKSQEIHARPDQKSLNYKTHEANVNAACDRMKALAVRLTEQAEANEAKTD